MKLNSNKRKGFTLVELIMAIFMLFMGLLFLTGIVVGIVLMVKYVF